MKKTLITLVSATALLVGTGASVVTNPTPVHAMNGVGANTHFISKTYKTGYKYLTVKDLYTKEVPTKAEKAKDAKLASKVNKVTLAIAKEQYTYDTNMYTKNKKLKPGNSRGDYTHKTSWSLQTNSKTKFAVRYKFEQSFSERKSGEFGTYKYKYVDYTFTKKTGSYKVTKEGTVKK